MEQLWEQFDRIVVFDTETTGIEFGKDRIIELGLWRWNAARRRTAWMRSSACRKGNTFRPSSWS